MKPSGVNGLQIRSPPQAPRICIRESEQFSNFGIAESIEYFNPDPEVSRLARLRYIAEESSGIRSVPSESLFSVACSVYEDVARHSGQYSAPKAAGNRPCAQGA